MSRKVLFLDTVHHILEERLLTLKYVCEHDYFSSKKEIEAKIASYFGIVIRSRITLDQTFLDKATNLKFIARSGSGLENIDIVDAQQKGIKVFNSPEGNRDAVGEHAIGMLLSLFNQLKKGDAEVRQGIWDREGNRGIELAGKTVGIIGYGNMGNAFAKKLSGFECKIIAYDKYKVRSPNPSIDGRSWAEEVSLEVLKEKSDIISIHLPLTAETQHYVDAKFISSCKKSFYLINTARGNHVKVPDLVEALKTGKILGACLDVLEYETKSFETINSKELPDAFNFLAQSDKVVLSPHVAGWTKESYRKLSSFLADKIEQEF
ncbi:MAG: hydroxyacid dehydrogenase [Flavobacteriales bacterium CG_4_10_14_0_2_um_filter_32_8]|nr:MAG: hydroxyacid dehydrogenase [Flavobacteriales bacterium CG_4_10_14_0_2_um_filter_32_8]